MALIKRIVLLMSTASLFCLHHRLPASCICISTFQPLKNLYPFFIFVLLDSSLVTSILALKIAAYETGKKEKGKIDLMIIMMIIKF